MFSALLILPQTNKVLGGILESAGGQSVGQSVSRSLLYFLDKLLFCVQNLFGEHYPLRPALVCLSKSDVIRTLTSLIKKTKFFFSVKLGLKVSGYQLMPSIVNML